MVAHAVGVRPRMNLVLLVELFEERERRARTPFGPDPGADRGSRL